MNLYMEFHANYSTLLESSITLSTNITPTLLSHDSSRKLHLNMSVMNCSNLWPGERVPIAINNLFFFILRMDTITMDILNGLYGSCIRLFTAKTKQWLKAHGKVVVYIESNWSSSLKWQGQQFSVYSLCRKIFRLYILS